MRCAGVVFCQRSIFFGHEAMSNQPCPINGGFAEQFVGTHLTRRASSRGLLISLLALIGGYFLRKT